MNIDERIANLVAATIRSTPIEQELLREDIIAMAPVMTANPGATAPLVVILDTRRVAYFKRFRDQNPNLCQQYRHDRVDVPLNEVTAWRLAWAMGDPWRQLLPTAVVRRIDGSGGALINQKDGTPDPDAFTDAAGQVMAAALFDALIGNQDRNLLNFRYDATSTRLGLIDHGFAFARPGDFVNGSAFVAARRLAPAPAGVITDREERALEALLQSGDLHGLRRFLTANRADALEERARRMLGRRCLLGVGDF